MNFQDKLIYTLLGASKVDEGKSTGGDLGPIEGFRVMDGQHDYILQEIRS